ncbi:AraC family transcriptional regulator [Streptomyces sp. NPDC006872]|uniref:AraC family transcriptional regulator n=1 Tax=Streptomyces sp. NPDC006872 TaxID=3155720 RepID=UPI0033F86393
MTVTARTTFTTLTAPPEQRVVLWQDYCRRHIPIFRCGPLGSEDVRISVRRTRFPRFEVAEVSGDSNLMERTPELIKSAPWHTISVGILVRGSAFVYQPNRIEVLNAGDALVYDPGSLCAYGRSDGFAEVVVNVPRQAFAERSGMNGFSEPRVIRASDRRAIAAQTDRLLRISLTVPADTTAWAASFSATVDNLLDLLVGGGPAFAHWSAAREYIRQNLADPKLAVFDVAAAVGLSERHLARVFADRRTTVGRVIAEERLRVARDLLADPRQQDLAIAQIARMAGFTSPSHFARAFRRAHGTSAKQLRDATRVKSESAS